MDITAAQVRAAREMLGWSQLRLAAETGVSASTVAQFEDEGWRSPMLDLAVVRRMLHDAGVEFIPDDPGVRRRTALGDSSVSHTAF
jgi:transcriptional regulator with XRE-family HTH domain